MTCITFFLFYTTFEQVVLNKQNETCPPSPQNNKNNDDNTRTYRLFPTYLHRRNALNLLFHTDINILIH
ncbi:hypothetical protein Glove_301g10 [Diversispora epigaea]|uniref:Uncharacterized protein n=1 Tax=Diversispora epigaea TaxID=1348612 RepID=A0A397HVZ6_9GLOM|nr:hypothetical protein Glove_301g10 [Diversispora epigaea]